MSNQATIYVDQGTDFLAELEILDDCDSTFDIVDQQFFCHVRKVYSETMLFEVDVTVDVVENMLSIHVKPEDTIDIEPGKYQYDVLMKETSGVTTKILEGLMIVLPTVTSGV